MTTLELTTPPSQRGQEEPRTRRRWVWALVCLAVSSAGLGCFWRYRQLRDPLAGLDMAVATRANIEDTVNALGKMQPHDYVDVGAQASGQLKRLTVQPGDYVKAGALLAEIDPQLQLVTLERDRARLAQLEAKRDTQLLQVEFSAAQYDRQLRMRKDGAAREDTVERMHNEMRVAKTELASIDAQIREARSATKADEAQLSYTRIFAPLSGTVVSIDARVGQTLIAVQQVPVLLRVADLSTMTVWSQVSEVDISRLHAGMELYFTILGQPERKWYAKLRQLLPAPVKATAPAAPNSAPTPSTPTANNNIVVYTALFDVDNASGELLPEMSAQVFFVNAAAKDAVVIPIDALEEGDIDRATTTGTVTVVDSAGKHETRTVKLGVHNRFDVQVLEGLSVGERVVKPTPFEPTSQSKQGAP